MAGECAAWLGGPGGAECPGTVRGPAPEARLRAPGGLVPPAGSSPLPALSGAGRSGGPGPGASWAFAQAWRPLRPHPSILVIVSGHRCPSLRRGAGGRAAGSPGRGLLLGPGWRRVRGCPAWGVGRGPRRARLSCRGRGGAARSRAAGTISGRRLPRGLTSARHSRKEGPLLRPPPARGGRTCVGRSGLLRRLGPHHGPRGSLRAREAPVSPAPTKGSASGFVLFFPSEAEGTAAWWAKGGWRSGRKAPGRGAWRRRVVPPRITLWRNVFRPAPPKHRPKYGAWPLPSLPALETQLVRATARGGCKDG